VVGVHHHLGSIVKVRRASSTESSVIGVRTAGSSKRSAKAHSSEPVLNVSRIHIADVIDFSSKKNQVVYATI